MEFPFLIPVAYLLLASFHPEVTRDQRYPAVGKLEDLKYCNIDRVMIGPDSDQFAMWDNDSNSPTGLRAMLPPSTIIFGRFHSADQSNKVESTTLSGSGLRLYPIRWSQTGGRLYIRIRETQGRVVAFSPEGTIEQERQLPEVWQKLDIASTKYGDLSDIESEDFTASLQRFVGPELIRGNVTFGDGPSFIGVKSSNLSLVKVENGRMIDLHLAAGWTRNIISFAGGNSSYPHGVSYLGAARTGRLGYRPYQRPIVDLGSGKVVGVFNPTTLSLDNDNKLKLESSIGAFLNKYPGKIILDASSNGNAVMVLIREPNGDRLLVRADPSTVHESYVCRDRLNVKSGKPTGADIAVSRIGSRLQFSERMGDPVIVKSSKGTKPNEVVVYIHGGPGGTLADELWQLRASQLVRPERELVALEYSGSVGGGKDLSKQLAKGGMSALSRDAGKLARWLKKRQYSKIYIVGESFGSILGQLLLKSHNDMVDGIFHIAPLLKLQNPKEWAPKGNGLNAVNFDTQLSFERVMFGGDFKRSRFAADIAELWSLTEPDGRTNFYFGEFDTMSQPSHIYRIGTSRITTIPYAGHALVGANSGVWADIEAKINSPELLTRKALGSESKEAFRAQGGVTELPLDLANGTR